MNSEPISAKPSFLRRILSYHPLLLLLIAFVGLILFLVVSVLILNWRGRNLYERARAADEAAGESYEFVKLLPKPVPDEQNFAMTSLLSPLLDYTRVDGVVQWRQPLEKKRLESDYLSASSGGTAPEFGNWEVQRFTDLTIWQEYYRAGGTFVLPEKEGTAARDVLAALDTYKDELAELRQAARRPYSQFPLQAHAGEGFDLALPHLAVLKKLTILLRLHALAALADGQPDLAMDDLRVGFRLFEALENEPLVIAHLVHIACIAILEQPIWEGIARGTWRAEHLAELQQRLERINQFRNLRNSIRGERALGNFSMLGLVTRRGPGGLPGDVLGDGQANVTRALNVAPSGFLYYNLITINDYYRKVVAAASRSITNSLETKSLFAEAEADLNRRSSVMAWDTVLARLLAPAFSKSDLRTRRSQATINLTIAACALERHKLGKGKYPENLAAMVPAYVVRVPLDPFDGKTLRYRLEADGSYYLLYSIGTDGQDGGGQITYNQKRTGVNPEKGDIVWSLKSRE